MKREIAIRFFPLRAVERALARRPTVSQAIGVRLLLIVPTLGALARNAKIYHLCHSSLYGTIVLSQIPLHGFSEIVNYNSTTETVVPRTDLLNN